MNNQSLIVRWVPFIFVILWATGFIGAKYGLQYAEPFTLLLIRMLLNLAVFFFLVLVLRSRWLGWREIGHSMLVGILVHALYLGGVFAAISTGMGAGVSSLLVGLQPIVTAYLAWIWLGDNIKSRQIAGLLLGTAGVFVVTHYGGPEQTTLNLSGEALMYCAISLLGICIGALYQKRYCAKVDLISGTLFQYLGASLFLLIPVWLLETGEVDWSLPLILVLAWMILGLSTVAVLLLMFMIREGKASKVASYFYLVPGVTTVMAWIAFGETLSAMGLMGLATSALGVYLVVRS